ncbi:hypothetical protein MTP99_011351 [Tenebrio molitor]|nr:hypothetical protein MTP99_011351 [Tenebrio molitor]
MCSKPSAVAKRIARHFTFGRSRVLIPVPLDQQWVFFRGFPTSSHRGMSHIIKRMLGQYQALSTYHLPSAPILTVPIPNLPVSVAQKALESLSSPPPFGGNERYILSNVFRNVALQDKRQCPRRLW